MANHQNAGNAGLYNATGGLNGMPSAGHYSDMQTLMQNMETLSGWLQQNREDFLSVQEGLEQVERRNVCRSPEQLNTHLAPPVVAVGRYSDTTCRLGTPQAYPHCLPLMVKLQDNVCSRNPRAHHAPPLQSANSDHNLTAAADPSAPTITSLQRSLDAANNRIAAYEKANEEHNRLQAAYEDTLTEATERIRNYVFQQNDYITSIHKHYTHLLQESRAETVQAQQIHQDWQRGLSKLNEELRRAVRAREDEKLPFTRKISALNEENRVLRGLAGWEPAQDDDSEDEELEAMSVAEGRGRNLKERERVVGNAMGPQSGK